MTRIPHRSWRPFCLLRRRRDEADEPDYSGRMTKRRRLRLAALAGALAVLAAGCATPPADDAASVRMDTPVGPVMADPGAEYPFASPVARASSITYLRAGNPDGGAAVPAAAQEEDVSSPDHVVGTGTPGSCTSAALAQAVRGGGTVVFNCGPDPITIALDRTLTTCNTHTCAHPWQGGVPVTRLVVDGGNLVTLSGQDQRGIFYANACEETFGWLTSQCNTETRPLIVFQNITLAHGNATSSAPGVEVIQGGGAIAMRGGQFKAVNVVFENNRCMERHSDGGGGAVRLTLSPATSYIVNSTFDSNRCANGGAVSGLHANIQILNSVLTNNTTTGSGASSGQGGNGGAVYGDGNAFHFVIDGSVLSGNVAPEGGPGVFYVSNNRTGTLTIRNSSIVDNSGQRFYTAPYRDIFYLGGGLTVTNSTVE